MFGLFKSGPEREKARLQKEYEKLLREARDIQRSGDMKAFALKSAEADKIADKIRTL